MYRVLPPLAECHLAECTLGECHFAECERTECKLAKSKFAECLLAECTLGKCHFAECERAECRGRRGYMAPWVKWPTSKSRSAYYLLTVCRHFVARFYDDVRGQHYF